MFVILTYDIGSKRVGKVLKVCRKYLHHRQRSVFDGELTESEVKRLESELGSLIDCAKDSVCVYRVASVRFVDKDEIGVVQVSSNII